MAASSDHPCWAKIRNSGKFFSACKYFRVTSASAAAAVAASAAV